MPSFKAWHDNFSGNSMEDESWWRAARREAERAVNADSLSGAESVLQFAGWGSPREAAVSLRRKFRR